jgi:predicted small secreted protein
MFGVQFIRQTGEIPMLRKLMTVVVIGGSLAMAACNTVRGAAADVNSAANAVDRAT